MVCWIAIGCNTMNIDLISVLGKLVLIVMSVVILAMEIVGTVETVEVVEMEKVMEMQVLFLLLHVLVAVFFSFSFFS